MFKNNFNNVPHLITSLQGPLQQIEHLLLSNQCSIECWLSEQLRITPPPIYCSVDLRNAGFKIAPVDTNLFPAGFNNLNPDFIPLCIQAVQSTFDQICPEIREILLIPEDHTRNVYYYENIAILHEIFIKSGINIRVGTLLADLQAARTLQLPSGRQLTLEPLRRDHDRIAVDNFSPSLILLNNDLSSGVPDTLQGLQQCIMPPLNAGWYSRLKSGHFRHYQQVAEDFSHKFNFDPWIITPLFRYCEDVDFLTKEGEACLVTQTGELLAAIQKKYQEYGIEQKPFLVVKADAGTYGMAVMMIQDPEELKKLNRKERTRMASIKGGREVRRVIIQEGVYTFEKWGKEQVSAEPVIYMIGKYVLGGFYRVHAGRGIDENLNAPGMNFKPLAFATSCNNPDNERGSCANRFYSYGVIARLALIAAARELSEEAKA
jgi:glutamate--cysteine ligase